MTVAALSPVAEYRENGVTTAFAVPFRFRGPADLVVERIVPNAPLVTLALGLDYRVTGGETDAGGTLTRTVATNGATLRIRRRTGRTQAMVYGTGDRFPAKSHEGVVDQLMLIDQEQDAAMTDLADRSLIVPAGEKLSPLPSLAQRAGRMLGFDAVGAAVMLTYQALAIALAPLLAPFVKGDPGGNVESIGLLVGATGMVIPAGTKRVRTSGYSVEGIGAADYVEEQRFNLAAFPWAGFVAAGNRVFRLLNITTPLVTQIGALGDDVADDTAAFNNGIKMLTALKGGSLILPKPRVRYRCDTVTTVEGKAGIIHLPRIPELANAISLAIVGQFEVSTTTGENNNDIRIETTQTGPCALICGSRPNETDYNYLNLTIANVRLRSPINSRIRDLDCTNVRNLFLDTMAMDVPPWPGATHPNYSIDIPELTNGIANVGLVGPANNIATTFSCRNVYIAGKAYGALIGELGTGDLTIVGCDAAVGLIAGHHKSAMTINVYNCSNLLVTISGPVKIDFKVRTEHNSPSGYAGSGPSWVATRRIGYQPGVAPTENDGYDIYDPNNLVSGTFDYVMSSVFDGTVPAENRIPFSTFGGRNIDIKTTARLGGILGGGYGLDLPFVEFPQSVTHRSSYVAINGYKGSKPWHLLNGRSTAPGSLIGAQSVQNYVDGQGNDFRASQIATLVGFTADDAYMVLGVRWAKVLRSIVSIRPYGLRFESPNAHLDTANPNNDLCGVVTFANSASVTKPFAVPYTCQAEPVVTVLPRFDIGANNRVWAVATGAPGNWTGVTVSTAAPVNGQINYLIVGNGQ